MNRLPISKSLLAPEALAHLIKDAYKLTGVRCQLITATMRDVYLVTSDQGHRVFFVYRHAQRTAVQIEAEWQFVAYLDQQSIPVAPAVQTQEGVYVLPLAAPEGRRYGVLTAYVAGKHLRYHSTIEAISAYGRIVAQIHRAADAMPSVLDRPAVDVEQILTQSIAAFEAEVDGHPDALALLQEAVSTLIPKIAALPSEKPMYGMVHGDVIRANAQVSDKGNVTILDFDLCGPGWRVYDVASYLCVIRGEPDEQESEQAFLHGYQAVRSLTALEQEALPLFEAVRAVFQIGIPAQNIQQWGSAYFYAFLDRSLKQLKGSLCRVG